MTGTGMALRGYRLELCFRRSLLLVLPSWLRNIEVSAHPDGELALEWYRERGWIFTVSINETGLLSYGALLLRRASTVRSS
jgi:hypothetical protein